MENREIKNLNPDLDEFSNTLEWLIYNQANSASKKSYGDEGFVIAIDGKWGSGKTYFLEWFYKKIKNSNVEKGREKNHIYSYQYSTITYTLNKTVVKSQIDNNTPHREVLLIKYNAWENDYFDDPFSSLVGQFCSQFSDLNSKQLADFKEKAGELAVPLASLTTKTLLNVAACIPIIGKIAKGARTTVDDIEGSVPEIVKKLKSRIFDEQMNDFKELSKTRKNFKDALSELKKKEVIKLIMVDELDRCKPEFAINFLETLKHFFNTPNTVFIIAIDKHSLAENAKWYYGDQFDGLHYLSRFFDIELQLPTSQQFFKKLQDANLESHGYSELIENLINSFELQPREQIKFYNFIKIIRDKLNLNLPEFYFLAALKMYNSSIYKKCINCKIRFTDSNNNIHYHFSQWLNTLSPIINFGVNHEEYINHGQLSKDIFEAIWRCFAMILRLNNLDNLEYFNEFLAHLSDCDLKNVDFVNCRPNQDDCKLLVSLVSFLT